ncbi:hypothetical protein HOG98_03935 [bacterium]|jgi:hypothetical protein|nr:hypothetical protein [bacterium]
MIKYLVAIMIFISCFSISIISSAGDQNYLHSELDYEFQVPTGSNTPTIYPLETKKKVRFVDDKYMREVTYVIERESQIEQYKCSNCHLDGKNKKIKGQKPPHDHIVLKHGDAGQFTCFDCHNENKRDVLKNNFSKDVSFNQSASLCYQCHSSQFKDWSNGAHGKRIGKWVGERVIYNCTQCHNPHDPGFQKRMPLAVPKMRGVTK